MEDQTRNWLSICVASLIPYALGLIWYAPKAFQKIRLDALNGKESQQTNPILAFLASYALSFLFSVFMYFSLDHGHDDPNYSHMGHGVYHGFQVWFMVAFLVLAGNGIQEKKPWRYVLVNSAYWLLSMILIASLLAVWY